MNKTAWIALCLLAICLVLAPLPVARADDQVVTNTNDAGAGSLRQALTDVNAGGTITFSLSAYPATIALTSGELVIDRPLTLTGPGAEKLTISGDNSSRVLSVSALGVTISDLAIADGLVTTAPARGGGVHNSGTLLLQRVTVRDNRIDAPPSSGAMGGGIYNEGTLAVETSDILSNTAVCGLWIAMPGDLNAFGGGIHSQMADSLTIIDSRLQGNAVLGGIHNPKGGHGSGGAVSNLGVGTLLIENSLIVGNTARGGDAPDSSGQRGEGGGVYAQGPTTIVSSTFSLNVAQGGHGTSGGLAHGGGLVTFGTTTIDDSTFDGNKALGGNATAVSNSGIARGGAIVNSTHEGSAVPDLTVRGSTFSNNVAQGGASKVSTPANAYGGGFSTFSRITPSDSTATFVNCTFGGNQANSLAMGLGGGLHVGASAAAKLSFCTIANNSASDHGGGIHSEASAGAYGPFLKSSIVADNTAPVGPDIFGTVNSKGWNLVSDDTAANLDTAPPNVGVGNIVNQPAGLGPLQNNGGPPTASGQATWTHALLPGSVAINGGSSLDIGMNPVTVDQRAFARPYAGTSDIGAYESGPADLVLLKQVTPGAAMPGQTVTYTLTISNDGYALAGGLVLTDAIPSELAGASVLSSTLAFTDTGFSPPYVWDLADLIPGHVAVLILIAEVETGLAAGHVFTNTATIGTTAQESELPDHRGQAAVTVLNAPPVAVDDSYITAPGNPLTVTIPGVLENDHDGNGDAMTAIKDSDPLSGTLVFNADGSFLYTPQGTWLGDVSFGYHANDGTADSNPATVNIRVGFRRVCLPMVLKNH